MTNFIQCTSGALSQQECDAVIDFFESNKERQVADTTGGSQIDDQNELRFRYYSATLLSS